MSQETVVPQDLLRQFNGTLVYRGKFNGFISQGEYFITRSNGFLYRNGGSTPIYKGRLGVWRPDTKERGIIIELGGRILRNGTKFICEDNSSNWTSDFQGGVIICRGSQFFRNDRDLICESLSSHWLPDARGGVIIRLFDQFLHNCTELIYEGGWNRWGSYRNGIMAEYDENDGTKSLVYYNPFDHMASPFDD